MLASSFAHEELPQYSEICRESEEKKKKAAEAIAADNAPGSSFRRLGSCDYF
jgi:hypothetical protein